MATGSPPEVAQRSQPKVAARRERSHGRAPLVVAAPVSRNVLRNVAVYHATSRREKSVPKIPTIPACVRPSCRINQTFFFFIFQYFVNSLASIFIIMLSFFIILLAF
jgi:hypothetical protein